MGQAVRDAKGLFLPGNQLAKGRKGSTRNLTEAFLRDMNREWQRSGPAALAEFAESDPAGFCRVVASLVPKEMMLSGSGPSPIVLNVVTGVPDEEACSEPQGHTFEHEPSGLTDAPPNGRPAESTDLDLEVRDRRRQLGNVPADLQDT